MPTPEEITRFLEAFKLRMEKRDGFTWYPHYRGVNRDTVTFLGILPFHVKDIISSLTFENYSQGPEQSRDPSLGNLWIFGTSYNGTSLYIKISDNFSFEKAKCVSFHFPSEAMTFPYKKDKEGL